MRFLINGILTLVLAYKFCHIRSVIYDNTLLYVILSIKLFFNPKLYK